MPRPPQSWTAEELARDVAVPRNRFVVEGLAALEREREAYAAWVESVPPKGSALAGSPCAPREQDLSQIWRREFLLPARAAVDRTGRRR